MNNDIKYRYNLLLNILLDFVLKCFHDFIKNHNTKLFKFTFMFLNLQIKNLHKNYYNLINQDNDNDNDKRFLGIKIKGVGIWQNQNLL